MIAGDGERLTFAQYVYGVWLRAGCPSARWLATRTGVSHTTVNALVQQGKAPRWETAAPLLTLLGADIVLAAELWAARPPAVKQESAAEGFWRRVGSQAAPRDTAALNWMAAPGFPAGRAFDTTHDGTVWRIALALADEPVGVPWLDEQPCDGWRLYPADGGRMQPIAAASRALPLVRAHAAIRICPRGIHR